MSQTASCRSDSGYRIYIMAAKRMIPGEVLKKQNGLLILARGETCVADSSQIALTVTR